MISVQFPDLTFQAVLWGYFKLSEGYLFLVTTLLPKEMNQPGRGHLCVSKVQDEVTCAFPKSRTRSSVRFQSPRRGHLCVSKVQDEVTCAFPKSKTRSPVHFQSPGRGHLCVSKVQDEVTCAFPKSKTRSPVRFQSPGRGHLCVSKVQHHLVMHQTTQRRLECQETARVPRLHPDLHTDHPEIFTKEMQSVP